MPPKTQREREAEQRQVKLERMKEQVDDGSLVIRKMSDEERAKFDASRKPRPPAAGGAKRRTRKAREPRSAPSEPTS